MNISIKVPPVLCSNQCVQCFCPSGPFILILFALKIFMFHIPSTGRRRQRKVGSSGSRTEIPNLADHESVQRYVSLY